MKQINRINDIKIIFCRLDILRQTSHKKKRISRERTSAPLATTLSNINLIQQPIHGYVIPSLWIGYLYILAMRCGNTHFAHYSSLICLHLVNLNN